jgi:hypothetical protein
MAKLFQRNVGQGGLETAEGGVATGLGSPDPATVTDNTCHRGDFGHDRPQTRKFVDSALVERSIEV